MYCANRNPQKSPVKCNARKVVATTDDHLDIVPESNIKHTEMFVLTTNTYSKRDKHVQDVDTFNKHLANTRQTALGKKYEEPITSEK